MGCCTQAKKTQRMSSELLSNRYGYKLFAMMEGRIYYILMLSFETLVYTKHLEFKAVCPYSKEILTPLEFMALILIECFLMFSGGIEKDKSHEMG